MSSSELIAIFSVFGTITVAVLTAIIPAIANWQKLKQEWSLAELERIDRAAVDLLRELSNFSSWTYESFKKIAGERPVEQLSIDLRAKYYAWERAVWSRLNLGNREKAKEIRKRFEDLHTYDDISSGPDKSDLPVLSDKILSLTYIAASRVPQVSEKFLSTEQMWLIIAVVVLIAFIVWLVFIIQ